MNVTEALNSRHTCRFFTPEPLAQETVIRILEAANRTPSWANTQPWEIFVAGGAELDGLRQAFLKNVQSGVPAASDIPQPEKWPAEIEVRMHESFSQRFRDLGIDKDEPEARRLAAENNSRFFGAPAVVYLCMDRTLTPWSMHDLGMMSQSIMLAAEENGVASAIVYSLVLYPDLIRKTLKIPEKLAVVIAIALGYAEAGNPQNQYRMQRRPLDEAVRLKGF